MIWHVYILSWWGICGLSDDKEWVNVYGWDRLYGFVPGGEWEGTDFDFWDYIKIIFKNVCILNHKKAERVADCEAVCKIFWNMKQVPIYYST